MLTASLVRWQNTGSGSGAPASGGSGSSGRLPRGKESVILIELEEGGRSFDTYMDLKFSLEDLFGRKADLIDRDAVNHAYFGTHNEVVGDAVRNRVLELQVADAR
ncbi:MAG TPA: hypothetical protein PK739_10795 [Methanoculleus sp.]|nr:hypothetical protein [Methanoculleus sp.]HPM55396.1 hypothetical protein [Methanoculleus sp.]